MDNIGVRLTLHGAAAYIASSAKAAAATRAIGVSAKKTGRDFEGLKKGALGTLSALDHGARRTSRIFRNVALGVAAVTAAIVAGMVKLGQSGFRELALEDAQVKITEARLISTGNAAKVSARHVYELSQAMQELSGFDSAKVQHAANIMLTFTKVANRPGARNDIFDQSILAAGDIARSFPTVSIERAAVQLGKALQDPIKGLVTLGRTGITFDADQRELIKKLVESGKLLEAQKTLLRAVQVQVNGTAEAYGKSLPGQMARARESWRDFSMEVFRTFGPVFVPMLLGSVKLMNKFWPTIDKATTKTSGILQDFWKGFTGNADDFSGAWGKNGEKVRSVFDRRIVPAFRAATGWMKNHLFPALGNIGQVLWTKVFPALGKFGGSVITGFRDSWNIIFKAFNDNRPQLVEFGNLLVDKVIPALGDLAGGALKAIADELATIMDFVAGIIDATSAFRAGQEGGPAGILQPDGTYKKQNTIQKMARNAGKWQQSPFGIGKANRPIWEYFYLGDANPSSSNYKGKQPKSPGGGPTVGEILGPKSLPAPSMGPVQGPFAPVTGFGAAAGPVTFGPGSIVVSGVLDPERAGSAVAEHVSRKIARQ